MVGTSGAANQRVLAITPYGLILRGSRGRRGEGLPPWDPPLSWGHQKDSLLLARCDYLAENKAAPECPGPSYPNGAAAYRHASILPRLGARTPFANSIARASRRIQGRVVCRDRAGGCFWVLLRGDRGAPFENSITLLMPREVRDRGSRTTRERQGQVPRGRRSWASFEDFCRRRLRASSRHRMNDGHDQSVVTSDLHGHDPYGTVTWQFTFDGENS
jgi:hypothetical protein